MKDWNWPLIFLMIVIVVSGGLMMADGHKCTTVKIPITQTNVTIPNHLDPTIIILYHDPDYEHINQVYGCVNDHGPSTLKVRFRDRADFEHARDILADLPKAVRKAKENK